MSYLLVDHRKWSCGKPSFCGSHGGRDTVASSAGELLSTRADGHCHDAAHLSVHAASETVTSGKCYAGVVFMRHESHHIMPEPLGEGLMW